MNKDTMLKNYCKNFLKTNLEIIENINSMNSIKKILDTEFRFKNNLFNKEVSITKKDYSEFFSRAEVRKNLEKNDEFIMLSQFLSARPNIKKFYSKDDIEVKNIIYHLIENYVIETNSFLFDVKSFEKIFKEFKSFVNDGITQVNYFTPLHHFRSDIKEKKFGDILLKQITSKQFKIIKKNLVGKNLPTPTKMYDLGYVLETKVPFLNKLRNEEKNALKIFSNFLQAAVIFQSGDLETGSLYRNYTKWTKYSSMVSGNDNSSPSNMIYKIKKRKISLLKKFYDEFSQINFEDKELAFLKLAIRRFHLSMSRTDSQDKIVDINIALESLFSSAGDTSLKFAQRICTIIADDDEKREFYWNFSKDEYKLRNDIVHGRNPKNQAMEDVSKKLVEITRSSITKFLNLIKHYSGKDIRKKILDDLDVGLINRTKLEKFLLKTTGSFD